MTQTHALVGFEILPPEFRLNLKNEGYICITLTREITENLLPLTGIQNIEDAEVNVELFLFPRPFLGDFFCIEIALKHGEQTVYLYLYVPEEKLWTSDEECNQLTLEIRRVGKKKPIYSGTHPYPEHHCDRLTVALKHASR